MSTVNAYDEIVDFIAGGSTPEAVIGFKPSEETKARVADLIARDKNAGLTADERIELEHYMQVEHIMSLAKARARRLVAARQS